MKTIKYLAGFLAAAFMFNACEEANVLNNQNKDQEKPSVTLTQKVADDVTLSFEIAASENAAQYAYAVFAGSDNPVPSAYDILVEEAQADASGSFNTSLSEDDAFTSSVTVDCTEFPAKTYQVFAAAITETGLIGEVVALDVTMNDTWIPMPAGAEPDGNVITLAFDEVVKRGTGNAYVSVIAWGVSQYYIKDQLVAEENIAVAANTVTITCPEAGAGAGYILSFDKGLVTDLSGNPCDACKSGLDQNGNYVNLGWDTDWVNFNITESSFETPAEDVDWAAEDASLTFRLPVQVFETGLPNPIKVVYAEDEGVYELHAEYELSEDDAQTVTVYLPKMPTGTFDVTVEKGAFSDMWGNINNEFNPAEHRYSNFLTALVEGTYLVDYLYADADGNPVLGQFPVYVELADRTTVVLSADWFNYAYSLTGLTGYVANPTLVGTIDYGKKTISFGGEYLSNGSLKSGAFVTGFYYYDEAKTQMLVFWGDGSTGKEPVVMSFDDDGYVKTMSYCDYSIHDVETGDYLDLYGCTAVTEDADARVTYVPETEGNSSEAGAPSESKLNPVYVQGNFRK